MSWNAMIHLWSILFILKSYSSLLCVNFSYDRPQFVDLKLTPWLPNRNNTLLSAGEICMLSNSSFRPATASNCSCSRIQFSP